MGHYYTVDKAAVHNFLGLKNYPKYIFEQIQPASVQHYLVANADVVNINNLRTKSR